MAERRVIYTNHAFQRMLEWDIDTYDVAMVLSDGVTVEQYPADEPYPSRLMVGWNAGRCIHVVAADDEDEQTIIITVYEPDPFRWEAPEFTRRKPRP